MGHHLLSLISTRFVALFATDNHGSKWVTDLESGSSLAVSFSSHVYGGGEL